MTPEEIQSHLLLGRNREVCVDITMLSAYPGLVRTLTLYPRGVVRVEFDTYGYDEGGVYFRGEVESLEVLIPILETYLGKPIALWENFTATGGYPDPPEAMPTKETWIRLKQHLPNLLPKGIFRKTGEG